MTDIFRAGRQAGYQPAREEADSHLPNAGVALALQPREKQP